MLSFYVASDLMLHHIEWLEMRASEVVFPQQVDHDDLLLQSFVESAGGSASNVPENILLRVLVQLAVASQESVVTETETLVPLQIERLEMKATDVLFPPQVANSCIHTTHTAMHSFPRRVTSSSLHTLSSEH
jgi:hypothetical protein